MKTRRLGLQRRWAVVVNALQRIVISYERASSRIALRGDEKMRLLAVASAVRKGGLVLDLGSGPGTMSRLVASAGGVPVLLDVSSEMLRSAPFVSRVQAMFEYLPFREGTFDSVVSGFAVRDSYDLLASVSEVARVMRSDGVFSFCDLGRPDSVPKAIAVALYLRVFPPLIGLLFEGIAGLGYGTIFDTYMLAPTNSSLRRLLSLFFRHVAVTEHRLGSSIVVVCSGKRQTALLSASSSSPILPAGTLPPAALL